MTPIGALISSPVTLYSLVVIYTRRKSNTGGERKREQIPDLTPTLSSSTLSVELGDVPLMKTPISRGTSVV